MGFDRDIAAQWQSLSLVIGGAFIGCIGLIAIKKLQGFSPLELQAWIAWLSLPVLLVLSLEFERPDLGALAHVSLGAWGALLTPRWRRASSRIRSISTWCNAIR